ncbi:hypothetical protein [Streptomyces sp. RFCAC02]|uniref:hypothetical protein n=1 Tax=Streptomyces sp. RFCAC02 TaxID=2499143 RepID=UPI00101FD11A|nr:hypothetical protein [Streptomyces sp. RFCAC02]
MRHTLRAEYAEDTGGGHTPDVKTWHMVRGEGGDTAALCGKRLRAEAAALSEDRWGTTDEPMCHTCGALYLRESS